MALYGVGKNNIEILSQDYDGVVRKINTVGDATLERTPNNPSCLKLKVRRNDINGAYTPENGNIVTLTVDNVHDMFFGYVVNTSKEERTIEITCYDQLWYFSQNSYSKNFGTISASDLYIKMADEFGFTMVTPPTVEDTVYKIPDVIMENAKPMDTMKDALNITFEHTGFRYYIYDAFNNLSLARGEHPETLKVNTLVICPDNCKSYTYEESIENMYNVIKLKRQSDKDKPAETVEIKDDESVHKYGSLEYSEQGQEGVDLNEAGKKLLEEKNTVDIKLHCSDVIGEPRVWGGSMVFVDFFSTGEEDSREYIRGWFQVDSVTHKFSNATHYMDLDLTLIWMYDDWEYRGIAPEHNYEKYNKDTRLW